MSNQKSLCCYAGIKLTGKDRPECEKCGRIVGTDLPERSVEEIIKELPKHYSNVRCSHDNPMVPLEAVVKVLQAERQKQEELVEAERERILTALMSQSVTCEKGVVLPSMPMSELQTLTQPPHEQ